MTTLPAVPTLAFAPRMTPLLVDGDLAYLSGIGPVGSRGTLGDDVTVAEGIEAARLTAQYAMRRIVDVFGTLDVVDRWVMVRGFVRSTPSFEQHPAVLNGFSDEIIRCFGQERGLSARSALGVVSLPLGMPIEVDAIVKLVAGATPS